MTQSKCSGPGKQVSEAETSWQVAEPEAGNPPEVPGGKTAG